MRSFTEGAALALALLCAACSPSEPIGGQGCVGDFLPGDLVVNEIFANPAGVDDGKEWFEIYNAGSATANLSGVTLLTAKNDGTGERKHRMSATSLAAGEYLVAGGVPASALPAGVDYGYDDDLGDLRNTSGRVQILCGTVVVDSVDYATVPEEQSRAFTGAQAPDAVANDDDARWCAAAPSPGAANASCTPVAQTECRDGASLRAIVAPAAGDLAIVEWMPNPKAVLDPAGEWFEVRVHRDVDLNGIEVAATGGDTAIGAVDCLRFAAGDHLLFARGDQSSSNGGLPAVDFTFDFDLRNSGGDTIVLRRDGVVLDELTYTTFGDGVSTQLDGDGMTCAGSASFGLGDKGTPGAANPPCGGTPGDTCNDGGTTRAVVAPAAGDLVITETMADPTKVSDDLGEWFELRVTRDVDLNGLQIGATLDNARLLAAVDCIRVTAGSDIVFARGMSGNGGITRVDRVFDFPSITNAAGSWLIARGGVMLDAVSWTGTTAGASRSLRPDRVNVTDNDDAASWCAAAGTYGDGDRGSPGAPNPACP